MSRKPWILAAIVVPLVVPVAMLAAVPKGWSLAGNQPSAYETGVDPETVYESQPSAYLKSIRVDICQQEQQSSAAQGECKGFGTLMQSLAADQYLGKRIRFSALVKSEEVDRWAGLWMRIDKEDSLVVLDNMQNRRIKGTSGWQNYQVVLDVPQDATGISFGILLEGHGEVWLSGVKFEVVGPEVPVTSADAPAPIPAAPVNLGFEKK